jgi:predicted aminopeptidase
VNESVRRRINLKKALAGLTALILAGAIVAVIASAEVRYLLRAGYEEARILLKRRSLAELIADSAVAEERRDLFALVLAARAFAADSLGLDAADTYTTFSDVGRDTLLLVLSASPKTALQPHVWRYPIVGRVPYKGFFDPAAAQAAARKLESAGYDVYLRPAAAFSTLGWFNDPLLSTALYRDPVSLVSTVIHEIAHNTLYVPGATNFNESFASFVGYRGAEAFFVSRGDSANAQRAAAMWHDEVELAQFYHGLALRLEELYAMGFGTRQVLSERELVFAAARATLVSFAGTRLETHGREHLSRRALNNASVIAARIYRTKLVLFDAVFLKLDGDLARTVAAIATRIRGNASSDPFQLLEASEPW